MRAEARHRGGRTEPGLVKHEHETCSLHLMVECNEKKQIGFSYQETLTSVIYAFRVRDQAHDFANRKTGQCLGGMQN